MLAHILGQCTYNKTERIRSHDELLNLVMAEIPKRNKETVIIKELRTKTNVDLESVGKNFCDFSYQIYIRHKDKNYFTNGRKKVSNICYYIPSYFKRINWEHQMAMISNIIIDGREIMPKIDDRCPATINIKNYKIFLTTSLGLDRNILSI